MCLWSQFWQLLVLLGRFFTGCFTSSQWISLTLDFFLSTFSPSTLSDAARNGWRVSRWCLSDLDVKSRTTLISFFTVGLSLFSWLYLLLFLFLFLFLFVLYFSIFIFIYILLLLQFFLDCTWWRTLGVGLYNVLDKFEKLD